MSAPPATAAAPSVLVPLAPGFEELELVAPVDLLRRAGVAVTVASLAESRTVLGRNGLTLVADAGPDALDPVRTWSAIFLPGGPGVAHLRQDARLAAVLRAHAASGRLLAAICAAPLVLHDLGLLANQPFTAHPSTATELPGAQTAAVVETPTLITSRGAGTAVAFGLALVGRLVGPAAARAVAESIVAPLPPSP